MINTPCVYTFASVQFLVHTWSNHLLFIVCFRCLFMGCKNFDKTRYSLIADCGLEKKCAESQKLGFFGLQDDLPTLLRHLWKIRHLHDGSICRQDFGSFAKILTTHENATRSLHTQNERMLFDDFLLESKTVLINLRLQLHTLTEPRKIVLKHHKHAVEVEAVQSNY